MSRFFPHTSYAEDQPYAHTILTAHVLYRGFQSGAVVGFAIGAARSVVSKQPFGRAVLGSTGTGALIGFASMAPGLFLRMRGREEIEWQDRSWRLLENQGQMEVDDWSLVGTITGAVVAGRREMGNQVAKGRSTRVVGGTAIGNLAGVTGYMLWRYGVHRGKWPEKL
jgi:hypothetical protein